MSVMCHGRRERESHVSRQSLTDVVRMYHVGLGPTWYVYCVPCRSRTDGVSCYIMFKFFSSFKSSSISSPHLFPQPSSLIFPLKSLSRHYAYFALLWNPSAVITIISLRPHFALINSRPSSSSLVLKGSFFLFFFFLPLLNGEIWY